MEDLTVINSKGSFHNINLPNNEYINIIKACNHDNDPILSISTNIEGSKKNKNFDYNSKIISNDSLMINNKKNNCDEEIKSNLEEQKRKTNKKSRNSNDGGIDNKKQKKDTYFWEESSDSENSFRNNNKELKNNEQYPTIKISNEDNLANDTNNNPESPEVLNKEDTQNTSNHQSKPTLIFDILRRKSMQAMVGSSMTKSNSNSRNESSKDVIQNLNLRKKQCFSSKNVLSNTLVNMSKHSNIKVYLNDEMTNSANNNNEDKEIVNFNNTFEESNDISCSNYSNSIQNNVIHHSLKFSKFYSVIKETPLEDEDAKEKEKDQNLKKLQSPNDANNKGQSPQNRKQLKKSVYSHSRDSESNKLDIAYDDLSKRSFSDESPIPKNKKSPSIKHNNNLEKIKNTSCQIEQINDRNHCIPDLSQTRNSRRIIKEDPATTPKQNQKENNNYPLNDSELSDNNSVVDKILKENDDNDEYNSSF